MERSKITLKECITEIHNDLDRMRIRLTRFLNLNGVETIGMNYQEVLEATETLKVMLDTKKYVGIVKDNNGYIIKSFKIDDFMEDKLPDDINLGFYYIDENEKLKIDYERKRQIEEV